MERVTIDDIESGRTEEYRTHDRRVLTEALGSTDVAVVHYVLEPGERFSGSTHAHLDQEEIFLIVEGEATFETADGEIAVGENEAVRFAPGEFQSGYNDSGERVEAFALGAPRESTDVRISHIAGYGDIACPECGHGNMAIDPTADESELVCPECGAGWN